MSDMITAEAAGKLLDGTTPGPWRADGPPYNRIVWSSNENRICFMAHTNGLDDARDNSTSNLVAAAPDLARTVIALHAQLADAKAAQAMVVERAAEAAGSAAVDALMRRKPEAGPLQIQMTRQNVRLPVLALADTDGLALVQALRADVQGWADNATEAWRLYREAEADRDRLAAANAALEAQVARLVKWRDDPESNEAWCAGNDYALTRLCKVLGIDPDTVSWDGSDGSLDEEADALIWRILHANDDTAALAEVQADARREGGE